MQPSGSGISGCRKNEWLKIEWQRVDLRAGLLHLEGQHTRAGRRRSVPLTEVRDLLGQSTVSMTERYAHLAPENVRVAVALLEGESRLSHAGTKERKGGWGKSLN